MPCGLTGHPQPCDFALCQHFQQQEDSLCASHVAELVTAEGAEEKTEPLNVDTRWRALKGPVTHWIFCVPRSCVAKTEACQRRTAFCNRGSGIDGFLQQAVCLRRSGLHRVLMAEPMCLMVKRRTKPNNWNAEPNQVRCPRTSLHSRARRLTVETSCCGL